MRNQTPVINAARRAAMAKAVRVKPPKQMVPPALEPDPAVPMVEPTKLTSAISTAIDKSTSSKVSKADANVAAATVVAAMKADPEIANSTNQEPLVQSRIVVGGSFGVIASLTYIGFEIATKGMSFAAYDQTAFAAALVTLWGAAFTLYGRLTPGLRPLFYGWFGRG